MDLFSGDLCPQNRVPSRCPTLASLLALLDGIPALLWATDLELRFTSLTGAGLEATGIRVKDFTGEPIEALFQYSGRKQQAVRAHRRALQGQAGTFTVDVGGRELEAHVQALRGADRAVIGIVGVALDGTERLVAERALRLSEQSSRLLIEEAPYAICRITESGQLLQVNRAMLETLGYGPGAEADLLAYDLPPVFSAAADFVALRQGLLNDSTVQGFETTWVGRSGQKIQVRIGGRAIRDAAGAVLYFDLLAENTTDRKQLEERLTQAEKMQAIGQLAGGVAHDFNNLLTVIGMQLEVALEKTLDNDVQRRLEDAKRAAERAAALTKQLLAFSRRQVLHSKILDLNRLIEQLSHMLGRLLRENIELTLTLESDLGSVKADPNQIEQVLVNLAVNAQDAMPQGGRLVIETSKVHVDGGPAQPLESVEPGHYVLITVSDTGCGMDRETQGHIFEPFFTTKRTGEGTGLGLSTAYGVVRQSGGYIQVESQPGQGSTFKIYLPGITEAEPVRVAAAPAATPGGSETILVGEDEQSVRKLIGSQLEILGYRVLTAFDGVNAIQVAREHTGTIDLLLTDLVMPKLGGRELAGELRKTLPRLKTIFISGYAGHDTSGKDLELPSTYFLQKPFSIQHLAKMVREVLDGVYQ